MSSGHARHHPQPSRPSPDLALVDKFNAGRFRDTVGLRNHHPLGVAVPELRQHKMPAIGHEVTGRVVPPCGLDEPERADQVPISDRHDGDFIAHHTDHFLQARDRIDRTAHRRLRHHQQELMNGANIRLSLRIADRDGVLRWFGLLHRL